MLERQSEALDSSVFTHHTHATRPLLQRRRGAAVNLQPDLTGAERIETEIRSQQFCATGPGQPGDTKHLAPMQRQRGSRWLFQAGNSRQIEHHFPRSTLRAWVKIFHRPANHHRDDPFVGRGRYVARANALSIP